MSKLSKVISVLLAMVLLFSTASVGVEAAYQAYKDTAINGYDVIDKPILSTEQYASMAMDEVDRMLGEANLKIEYDIGGFIQINADFTSVDKALKSVADLYASIKSMMSTIGGDIQRLVWTGLLVSNDGGKTYQPIANRQTDGKTDIDVFLELLKFLSDNASIIEKVPKGTLDLGIIGNYFDVSEVLDIPKMVRQALAGLVSPDTPKEQLNATKTIDQYVKDFIEEIASGDYANFKDGISGLKTTSKLMKEYVPGITDEIDLFNDSVYTVIDKGVKIALNSVAIPYLNPRILAMLGRLCGYDYEKGKDADGDTIWIRVDEKHRKDEPNAMTNVINWNEDPETGKITGFQLENFPVESWDDTWIVDHVNDILGQVVREAIKPEIEIEWNYEDGNDALVENIISVAKTILANTGDALFARYVEVLTPEQLAAMDDDDDAFIAYVLRSILNGSISDVYIPNTCDTTLEVLYELVKTFAVSLVPSRVYPTLDPENPTDPEEILDNIYDIGLDCAVYGLNGITNMNLSYGLKVDPFADACVNWLIRYYGNFLEADKIVGDTGWQKINSVLFKIIPANWLSRSEDGLRNDLKTLLFEDIVENIVLNFDLASVLDILDKNATGELNSPLITVILSRLTNIVNFILPGVFPSTSYTHLEDLMDPATLGAIVKNLLTKLESRARNGLLDALLPVVCAVLDLSDPESFGYPYISLEDQHTVDQASLSTFYIYNGSSGINTNATDKYGNRPQEPDKLYTYKILSITTSNPDVTVSPSPTPSEPKSINGGDSETFTLSGVSYAKNSVLKVTVKYNVENEKGQNMTPFPLTATTYTYIYDGTVIIPDDEPAKKDTDPSGNYHLVSYTPATYMSVDSTVGSLADYTMDLIRKKYADDTYHAEPATFSVDSVTIDSNLASAGISANIPFSVDTDLRGASKAYKAYKVADPTAKLAEGIYTNSWQFKATATEEDDEIIYFPHKILVYDDFDLGSLLKSAVNADRQEANYAKDGGHEARYLRFGIDPEKVFPEEPKVEKDEDGNETEAYKAAYAAYLEEIDQYYDKVEDINGADAWDRYVAAVDAAAAVIYAPRQIATMNANRTGHVFQECARELYNATKELEGCSESSGTASIKSAVEQFVPADTYVDEYGVEVEYDYDDARHTYFGRADYVNYTYSNFKREKRAADRVIDAEKEAEKKGETYQIEAVRAAYLAHRVSLYGERLIRVKAYTRYLQEAITAYTDLYNAGQGEYSNKTWNDFTQAYNFANLVMTEPIGDTVSESSENLAGDGLRQTKVNEARSHLIKAAKRLTPAVPTVDYTEILALIEQVTPTFEAGNDGKTYTEESWTTFRDALRAANKIVDDELEAGVLNQAKVDEKCEELQAAFEGLKTTAPVGKWEFDPTSNLKVLRSEINDIAYVVGMDRDYPVVSEFVITTGDFKAEVITNELWDMESTGAILKVTNGKTTVCEVPIVFYGDINGDGLSDLTDTADLISALGYAGANEWEFLYDFPEDNPNAMAADMNHDAMLDLTDQAILDEFQGYAINYFQDTISSDDIISEYI